ELRTLQLLQERQCLLLALQPLVVLRFDLILQSVLLFGEEGYDPVGCLRLEVLYLTLTLHDQTHGDRLNTSGREGGLDLSPQYGRELKTYDAVQHATCLLRINQVLVYFSWFLNGFLDCVLGDLVKDDA